MHARVFITGGTGFFGKSMLDYRLRHPEWKWAKAEWVILSRAAECFKTSYPHLANQPGISLVTGDVRSFAFPEGQFDAIIHAATSTTMTLSDKEMSSIIADGTNRVVAFAKAMGISKILFTSSGAVYGPRTSPSSEKDVCLPTTAYGKGKLSAEKLLADSGLEAKIARCFAFVGPHLARKSHYAIGNFIQDCLDGNPITINGDGTPLRSYLYADDLVEWLFAILERGNAGQPYNVGSDEAVSILTLAKRVRDALGASSPIIVERHQEDAPASTYVPVVDKAKATLGLCQKVSLEDAVRMSVWPQSIPCLSP